MRYIDKHTKSDEGNSITDEYLENECKMTDPLDDNVKYINIEYAGSFTSGGYKNRLLNLCMEHQRKYCCYCLRKIGNSKRATLEHIIPQKSADTDGYNNFAELSNREIILTSDFINAENQARPPYPHTVAWNNITASCDGRFPLDNNVSSRCCNNARSSDYAPPVYYLENIESLITYMENGMMMATINTPQTEDVQQTIEAAKLNCQPLKEIRRLWYMLRDYSYKEIVACKNKDRRQKLLLSILQLDSIEGIQLYIKYIKDDYWEVFMKYHLFYKIFHGKNRS